MVTARPDDVTLNEIPELDGTMRRAQTATVTCADSSVPRSVNGIDD